MERFYKEQVETWRGDLELKHAQFEEARALYVLAKRRVKAQRRDVDARRESRGLSTSHIFLRRYFSLSITKF